ncbi:hypothetical protein [Catenulispora rubra]|uniref:hypothetical protein n=1 Tax=Catenulispora rubra TaxID=280293 RepID=UPI0018925678|nr:hypothetical protein [Catenulispora rubra]
MDEKFEEHLTTLMNLRTAPGPGANPPFSPADVLAGVRRRSRARALGIAGSALAVIAIGAGVTTVAASAGAGGPGSTVTTAGSGSAGHTGSGTSAGALTVSPVQHVTSSTQTIVADGHSFTVAQAEQFGAGPNLVLHSPSITSSVDWTPAGMILVGGFHGAQVPSLIDVIANDGKHYTATIVEVDGLKDWVGYYAILPTGTTPSRLAPVVKIWAYDAAGNLLGQPPQPE